MTALIIHLDDSGTHTTSRVATIGAWISRVPMWERFTTEWKRALEKHGIKKFHMAEFMANNQHSEFADKNIWNHEKKRTVLSRLTQITRKHTMQGLGFAVNVREYNSAIPEPMRAITGRYHYTFALRLFFGLFAQYRTMHGFTEPTEYVFDRMTKGDAKKEIETVFNEAENLEDELPKYGIYKGCHSFRDKYDAVPLQASDMAAWLVNQRAQNETEGISANPLAIELWNALVKNDHFYGGVIREPQLTRWLAKERATPGTGTYELFQKLEAEQKSY